jgi:hypothetical protein
MAGSVRRAVLTQVDWWWRVLFRRRLDGLIDDELWWEPVPGCWTLHADEAGVFRYEWPPGSRGEVTPPFTTMAWRLCHLGCSAMARWTMWERWRAAVRALSEDDMWRPLAATGMGVDAPIMRLGGTDPFVHHLLHQQREFIHHGAEVSLLRDLYRARDGTAG